MASPDETKPLLVFLAANAEGHMAPTMHVAREMIRRGFGAAFLAAPEFRASIEQLGAEWWENEPLIPAELIELRNRVPPGVPRLIFDMSQIWVPSFAPAHARLRALLVEVRRRDPNRPVVLVPEVMSLAVMPFKLGAPLPTGYDVLPPVVAINVIPLMVSSMDTAPFGLGLPPDATESGRLRNQVLNQMAAMPFSDVAVAFRTALKEQMGCTTDIGDIGIFDMFVRYYDTVFQLCGPSLEYPRSDLFPNTRYAGSLPPRGLSPSLVYPSWWPELTANAALPEAQRKKVVAVAQGTLAVDYRELVLPALQALAKRDDVLVVAFLGVRGAKLTMEKEGEQGENSLPANARVIDYFPYDAVLEHADVFITNGGYGSVTHGIINGVPMVVAGMSEDKVEVTARVAYAGIGVNLKTQTPTVEAIGKAVDEVLGSSKYKSRIGRLKAESEDLDALSIIEREIRKKLQQRK